MSEREREQESIKEHDLHVSVRHKEVEDNPECEFTQADVNQHGLAEEVDSHLCPPLTPPPLSLLLSQL